MGNCDTHLFLGSNSTKTVEYFSKALGEKTISRESISKSKDKDGHKSGTSDSEQIMARALMTPDELRRMSMDYCIIFEKGIKPVKAKKLFFFKTNMLKEFNKFKLNHNNFDAGVRGTWRKFNPYNPDAGLEDSEPVKDLNVDSLDDLFDDDGDISKQDENNKTVPINSRDYSTNNITRASNNQNSSRISDDDLDELLFDDDVLEENDNSDSNNDDVIDIQKELEAKFDELFGSDSDN